MSREAVSDEARCECGHFRASHRIVGDDPGFCYAALCGCLAFCPPDADATFGLDQLGGATP